MLFLMYAVALFMLLLNDCSVLFSTLYFQAKAHHMLHQAQRLVPSPSYHSGLECARHLVDNKRSSDF